MTETDWSHDPVFDYIEWFIGDYGNADPASQAARVATLYTAIDRIAAEELESWWINDTEGKS